MPSSIRTSPRLAAKYEKEADKAFVLMYETFYGSTGFWTLWNKLPEPRPDPVHSKQLQAVLADYNAAIARCVNPDETRGGFMDRLFDLRSTPARE